MIRVKAIIEYMQATSVKPLYPKNNLSRSQLFFSYGVSGFIVVMLTAQLMTFEKFIPILENYQLPGGDGTAHVIAVLTVVCQWLSLPFLLRMSLSPLFRVLSALSLCSVSIIWLYLALWVTITQPPLIGSGILGGLFTHLLDGSKILFFSVSFCILVVVTLYILRKDISTKQ